MPTRSLASVIPPDDDSDAHSASQGTDTAPADKSDTEPATEPATNEDTGKPAEKRSGRARSRKADSRASSTTPRTSRTAGTTKPAPAKPATNTDETPAAEQRTGRPRIPKTGPITRVTVDLAVTEQTQLEQLAGKIGREIGRGHGRNRIYPQHLMRVAIRRLLTDTELRDAVTADLADGRDELRRPQR